MIGRMITKLIVDLALSSMAIFASRIRDHGEIEADGPGLDGQGTLDQNLFDVADRRDLS
jgi:hypothetical protein